MCELLLCDIFCACVCLWMKGPVGASKRERRGDAIIYYIRRKGFGRELVGERRQCYYYSYIYEGARREPVRGGRR